MPFFFIRLWRLTKHPKCEGHAPFLPPAQTMAKPAETAIKESYASHGAFGNVLNVRVKSLAKSL